MLPATAVLTYRRFSEPAAHRTPCPKIAPLASNASPCSTMLVAVGFSSRVVKTSVSLARDGAPEPLRRAPPVAELLLQPRDPPLGGFEQGQPITPVCPARHPTPIGLSRLRSTWIQSPVSSNSSMSRS